MIRLNNNIALETQKKYRLFDIDKSLLPVYEEYGAIFFMAAPFLRNPNRSNDKIVFETGNRFCNYFFVQTEKS